MFAEFRYKEMSKARVTRKELLHKCKEIGVSCYSNFNKDRLKKVLNRYTERNFVIPSNRATVYEPLDPCSPPDWVLFPDKNGKFHSIESSKGQKAIVAIREQWNKRGYKSISDLFENVEKTWKVKALWLEEPSAFIMALGAIFKSKKSFCSVYDHSIMVHFREEPLRRLGLYISNHRQTRAEFEPYEQQLIDAFEKCENEIFVIDLTLLFGTSSSHSNIIIINKLTNTWILFDPHGTSAPWHKKTLEAAHIIVQNLHLDNFTFGFCPMIGPQRKSIQHDRFCAAWSLWVIVEMFLNPHVSTEEIFERVVDSDPSTNYTNICKFVNLVDSMLIEFNFSDEQWRELNCAMD